MLQVLDAMEKLAPEQIKRAVRGFQQARRHGIA
jgi:hypothetical protein